LSSPALSTALSKLRQSRLLRGGLIVGAGILLGNVTGFFRAAVTAYLLGTHARADALSIAIGPLDTLNSVIVNTMLFAFVPMLLLRGGMDREAFFLRAARVFGCIFAGVSCLTALFAPELIAVLGPGLAAPERAEAIVLLRWLAPSTLFAAAGASFSAMLYTERRFIVPGLYQACLNGATIAGALLLRKTMGVTGFAIGYSAGAALQLSLTWWFSRDLRNAHPAPDRTPVFDILSKPGMFMLYAGLIAGNLVVTRVFATHAGPGMAAAFDYCIRCVNVVMAYLVYPVAATLVPEIARLRGTNESSKAYSLMDRSLVMMAVAATLSCAAGVMLRTPMIALLFERGNFTPESTQLVSGVFLGFAPSLIGWAMLELIARCFFALDRPRLPLLTAFIPVTINVIVMSTMRAQGRLMTPATLGLGATLGLLTGFAVLFAMVHIRRGPEREFVLSRDGTEVTTVAD
jgi:putative peptidoglycan lipid II flippase